MNLKWTDKRKYKFLYQRLVRGFGDEETWNMDYVFSVFILPRLKRFRELHNCCPANLTPEKWENILNKMIFAFERIIEDPIEYNEKLNKKMDEGLKLFGKYFRQLWW